MAEDFVKVVKQGRMISDAGGGLSGPRTLDVEARHPELEGVEIQARITLLDGVYEVTDLRMRTEGDRPLPPESLRQIPMRTLVRLAVGPLLRQLNLDKIAYISEPETRSIEATRLGLTAHVYRMARLMGEPPTEAVREALGGVSRATASRAVADARDKGYLRRDEIGWAGGARSRLGE